jgi:integral membrane sensor domain MASE1
MTLGSALIGESWRTNLLYNVLNLVEVLIGALLLRRKSTQLPRFTNRKYLLQFVGFAYSVGAIIQLQFFVACCIFMIYLVSVILEERDATEYRLEEITSIRKQAEI